MTGEWKRRLFGKLGAEELLNFMITQATFWNSKIDIKKLGGYVYGLVDPRCGSIFYIGKGGGLEAQGNKRPDGHLEEALNYYKRKNADGFKKDRKKLERIISIWESNNLVKLIIIRRMMNSLETKHVESALIDMCKYKITQPLTNIPDGHGKDEHGLVNEDNAVNLYAKPVNVDKHIKNVWLFNIAKALKERNRNYFDATVGYWTVGKKFRDINGYAIGLEDGISRVVIKINKWRPDIKNSKKYVIDGEVINHTEIGSQLFEKDFSIITQAAGAWNFGSSLIINLSPDAVEYVKGKKENKNG